MYELWKAISDFGETKRGEKRLLREKGKKREKERKCARLKKGGQKDPIRITRKQM